MKLIPLMEKYTRKSPVGGWEDDCDRYIGFIDIMGFKDLVARRPHQEIKHLLLQMNQTRTILLETLATSYGPGLVEEEDTRVKSISFSDSIVFVTKSDSPKDLFNISVALKICQEATIHSGAATKGALSHGKVTIDFERSIFFGQPIIDAYLLQDQLYYYGIVVDNNVEVRLKAIIENPDDKFPPIHFIRLQTPLKTGRVNHFNIKLNSILQHQLDYLYNNVSGGARKYVDNTIEMYKAMNPSPPLAQD